MFLLIFLVVIMIVYVKSFKEDFTAEETGKVAKALYAVGLVVILYSILVCITGN